MDNTSSEDNDNRLNWRKSARSVAAGNCTEVASTAGFVVVRDSMDQAGPRVTYGAAAWRNFGQSVRQGHFDIRS
jgi:hypothetical protein